MKLYDLLMEGVMSPVLYHLTTFSSCLDILRDNAFALSSALGTDADMRLQKGKFYFLSTSRIKFGGYARSVSPIGRVTLELDGRALGYNYTSVNVDYWGPSWRKVSWEAGNIMQFLRNNENEERIITNDPYIENANRYIKSIHAFLGENPEEDLKPANIDKIQAVEQAAASRGVDIYFYTDEEAWKFHNTRKAFMALDDFFQDFEGYEDDGGYRFFSMNDTMALLDIIDATNKDQLDDKAKKMYHRIGDNYTFASDINKVVPEELIRSVKREIHNNKTDRKGREVIARITGIMNRRGFSTIEEFVQFGVQNATEIHREDYAELVEEYRSLADAIVDVMENTKYFKTVDSLDRPGHVDAIIRYFPYDEGNFRDWDGQKQEMAYRTLNDLNDLMRAGYFPELKRLAVRKANLYTILTDFLGPIMDEIAENEGWTFWHNVSR